MKRIKAFLIIIILFPIIVSAKDVGANLQGITIYRQGQGPNTGGTGDCGTNPFWYAQNTPIEGLRITFYSTEGEQIGTTVDVWNTEFGGSKKLIDDKSSIGFKGYAINYTQFGHYYVYVNKKTGEANYKPTRIDFLNANLQTNTNYELQRYYLGYRMYVDEEALKITCSGIKTSKKNPFTYTEDSAQCLIKYFTTKEEKNGVKSFPVMDRYLALTGADKYASTLQGNYTMLLEPIIKIDQCGGSNGPYVSITTTSEWGMVNKKDCENVLKNTYCKTEYATFKLKPTKENGDKLQQCLTDTKEMKWDSYQKRNEPYVFNGNYNSGYTHFVCGVGHNALRQTFFNHLSLGSNQEIGGYSFRGVKSNDARHILSPNYFLNFMDMLWLDGFGIGAVNGTDLCEPDCTGNRYKIVYRTIDLVNPFLGIDGKKRTLNENSNWYSNETTIDEKIYQKAPLYSIILKPATIKAIRDDNKNIKYVDIMAKYSAASKFKDSAFKKQFGL